MKIFRFALIIAALSGVAIFPSCSGGGEETGNQFVSVTAFKSGSVGFHLIGSPTVWLESDGEPQNISSLGKNPFPEIGRLDATNSSENVLGGEDIEETWNNFAGNMSEETTGSSSCYVRVSIYNSQDKQYSIRGTATYTVGGQMGYLNLFFDEVSGSNNNLEYSALIHFMGALTQSDLTYSTDGDGKDNSGTTTGANERVLITTLTGSQIKFWFNFETNQCLTELCYVANQRMVMENGTEYSEPVRMRGVWRITHPFVRANQ